MSEQEKQEQAEETEEVEVANVTYNPNEWSKFMSKMTAKVSEGSEPKKLAARMVWTTIMPEMCRPDTFDGPLQVGMRELDSGTERAVQLNVATQSPKASNGDDPEERDAQMVGSAFSMLLAKAAIVEVNGCQLHPHEVDILWEAIGMGGRQRCAEDFSIHCCGMNLVAMGKSRALVKVG